MIEGVGLQSKVILDFREKQICLLEHRKKIIKNCRVYKPKLR